MQTDELFHRLAQRLEGTRSVLVQRWLDGVRHDPELPSAGALDDAALTAPVQALLDDVVLWLRKPADADVKTRVHLNGVTHGETRWHQGFRLEELLGEQWRFQRVLLAGGDGEWLGASGPTGPDGGAALASVLDCLQAHGAGSTARLLEHWGERLHAANAQLASVDASRLSMLRAVSHELSNALQTLTLGLGAVAQGTLDPERRRILALCSRSLADMESLLQELRDYGVLLANGFTAEMEELDVAAFADGLSVAHRLLAEARGLKLHVRTQSGLHTVVSDPRRLRQIAANLITNAVKYRDPAKKEGWIEVTLGPASEGRWSLAVQDNGIGIGENDLERIFDEFQRVTPRREIHGTGLGLAITRRLAALLGGEVRVTSRLGEGSRFVVDLPVQPSA